MKLFKIILFSCFIFLFSCLEEDDFNDTTIVTIYPESCSNGILDSNEEETDCGGICEECPNYFDDPRDNQRYNTIKIGNQRWMTENLNYYVEPSYCYDNDPSKCNIYGRMYSLDRTILSNLCPEGWELPTKMDWETLVNNYSSTEEAYNALITGGDSGFNATLGGVSVLPEINSYGLGSLTSYWSSSEYNSNRNWTFFFSQDQITGTIPTVALSPSDSNGTSLCYCRCMKNI